MTDDPFFERALVEYREATGDQRDFPDLPNDVQRAIIQRAQQVKADQEREKRG